MKPAPTAAEIKAAREWIARVGASQGYTEECALVLLSALDAAEARAVAEYGRGWDANVEASREILARAEAAEEDLKNTREALRVASQEVFKFKRETGEWKEAHRLKVIRAETAERERDEARAALKPFAIYAETRDSCPMRGLGDVIHAIHTGAGDAEITLTDCRAAAAALREAGR